MMMPNTNAAMFGNFATTVRAVLYELWVAFPPFEAAMSRAVDSTWDPCDISKWLKQLEVPSWVAGQVFVTPESLKLANERRLFTGFDEIWFLNKPPAVLGLLERISRGLTCDAGLVDKDAVEELTPILKAVECHLVLADGTGLGLNCITTDVQFWDALNQYARKN
jgi:hypothetical protein